MRVIQDYLDEICLIPPEHQEVHGLLENWARWCRSRPHRPPRGCEIEWEMATPPPAPLPPPNKPDAIAVERVMRFVPNRPQKYRDALKERYYFGSDASILMIELRVRRDRLPGLLWKARQMVRNRLKFRNSLKNAKYPLDNEL
jgi:hypothetical protein